MKVYTAFLTSDINITLHCTHKYLGDLEDYTIALVKGIIGGYFHSHGGFTSFEKRFDVPDKFPKSPGSLEMVSVLKSQMSVPYPRLRGLLDSIRDDDFPFYQPHITLLPNMFQKYLDVEFKSYALIADNLVLKAWTEKPEDNIWGTP